MWATYSLCPLPNPISALFALKRLTHVDNLAQTPLVTGTWKGVATERGAGS